LKYELVFGEDANKDFKKKKGKTEKETRLAGKTPLQHHKRSSYGVNSQIEMYSLCPKI
jgi:hypothetical protein